MGKGGGGSGSTSTTFQPPGYALPYISQYLRLVGGIPANAGGVPTSPGLATESYAQAGFPNYQVAPFTDMQNQGLGMTPAEAAQMGGLNQSAFNEANATLNGQYLIPPQNVQDALNYQTMMEYNQAAAPSEMSSAAQAGAFGGSADAEARAMNQFNLGTALSNTAYGLYEQERQNQLATASDLPKFQLAATMPSEALQQAGGLQQAQQQNELNATYQNLYNQAAFPFEQANMLGQMLGTAFGGLGTETGTQTMPSNIMGSVLGLGSLGLGAYNSGLFGSIGGGLSSLFGSGGGGLSDLAALAMTIAPAAGA